MPDSLYQVTIKHRNDSTCEEYDRIIIDEDFLESYGETELINNPKSIIIDKRIMEINHKDYAIVTYQKNLNNLKGFSVEAITFVDRQSVTIRFDCLADNCNDFLKITKKSLMSLKIQRREMFSIK